MTLLVEPRVGRLSPSGDSFCWNEHVEYLRNFMVVLVGELTDGTVGPTVRLTTVTRTEPRVELGHQ